MTPLLAAWIAISTVGFVVSTYLTNDSRLDIRALHLDGSRARALARSRFWREGIRITVHAAYIYAALAAADILPGRGVVIVPILMWGNIAMLINSIIDLRARSVVMELLEATEDG